MILKNKRKSLPVLSIEMIKEFEKYYQEYSIFGGYPRVVLTKDKDEKIIILKNIYNTYFLREIRDILQIATEEELQKLIKSLSLQIGSEVVYNELCSLTSQNYLNLIKHINILENTYIIKKVHPYCKNKKIEISKAPKIYFIDNGFRNVAIDNFLPFNKRVDRGMLNENFVASQLIKQGNNVNYWRTKSNAELDFIIERNNMKIAIEVKSSLTTDKVRRGLLSFKEKYAPDKIIVVSENYSSYDKIKKIYFIPLFFI
ncbi:MAG: DUF4143 domain-containing protein [Candidatus Hydrogenedentota bacterium]